MQFRTQLKKLQALQGLGFSTPASYVTNAAGVESVYADVNANRESLDFDIDGLVIRVNEEEAFKSLGSSSDNKYRLGSIALKFPSEGELVEIKKVHWSFEGILYISPVGIYDPVYLVGANLTNAQLKSIQWMRDNNVGIGSIVRIKRSGDVIPTISGVELAAGFDPVRDGVPTVCPHCGSAIEEVGARIRCVNYSCCAKEAARINAFLKATKITSLAWDSLMHYTRAGITLNDFIKYKAGLSDLDFRLMVTEGVSMTVWAKVAQQIKEFKGLPAPDLLAALPIAQTSTNFWEIFIENEMSGDITVSSIIETIKVSDPSMVGNYCYASGGRIGSRATEGLASARQVLGLLDLEALQTWLSAPAEMDDSVDGSSGMWSDLNGKRVVFTGTAPLPRAVLQAKLKASGAVIQSSVSGTTDFLFLGDVNSTTNKAKDARKIQEAGGSVQIKSYSDLLGTN